jgi:hypothetical protein
MRRIDGVDLFHQEDVPGGTVDEIFLYYIVTDNENIDSVLTHLRGARKSLSTKYYKKLGSAPEHIAQLMLYRFVYSLKF